jgi:hypothetical protein
MIGESKDIKRVIEAAYEALTVAKGRPQHLISICLAPFGCRDPFVRSFDPDYYPAAPFANRICLKPMERKA